jgi:hypothetical protein
VPAVVVVKVTLIVHEVAGSTLVPQVFVCEKPVLAEMLVILSADAPVLVSFMVCGGGGHRKALQAKFKLSGTSSTVPLVSVIVALFDFVLSVTEIAFKLTLALAGNEGGAVNFAAAPLAVLEGLTVPQAGEHTLPFWVTIQFKP